MECFDLKANIVFFLRVVGDSLDLVHVLAGVLVAHVGRGNVQLKVGAEVLEVVVVGQLVGDFHSEGDRRLVRPAPRHVSDGVSAAAWDWDGTKHLYTVLPPPDMTTLIVRQL